MSEAFVPTNLSCPNCGQGLTELSGQSSQTPPYVCDACRRGWWPIELGNYARDTWVAEIRAHADPILMEKMISDDNLRQNEKKMQEDT